MKSFFRLFLSFIFFGFFLFFISCQNEDDIVSYTQKSTWQQTKNNELIDGVVRIKFVNELTDKIEFALKSGRIHSNVREVDEAMATVGVKSITRTFPYAGKYEERTRNEGLHLWYDVVYDTVITSLPDAMAEFASLKDIETTEPIRRIRIAKTDKSPFFLSVPFLKSNSTTSATLPFDDPYLIDQWHYYNDGSITDGISGADINLFNAWLKETGSPDVIVSVVDGGVDFEHEDLHDNMWVNATEFNGSRNVDDDNNGYVDDIYGYNFVVRSGKIKPHDHGTHVAGTIGAVNNNSLGVSGIAGGDGSNPGVRLMSCQVFSVDENGEETSAQSFAEAIKYGADNGAVISQNSWSYEELDYLPSSMQAAIDYFNKYAGVDENDAQIGPMKGGVVIFAAGNDNSEIGFPASYDGVVAVASMAPDYRKAYYSNFGTWVDITAPGGTVPQGDMYSVGCQVLSTIPGDNYGYMQGTSMACPHVSGIAALIVSKYGGIGFTSEALKQRLYQGATDIDLYNSRYIGKMGVGLVNAAATLASEESLPPEPVEEISVSVTSNNIELSWGVTADPDDVKPVGFAVYFSNSMFTVSDLEEGLADVKTRFVEVGQLNVGDPISTVFSDLDFETTYYFAIAGFDIIKTYSSFSPVVNGVTESNNPPVITTSESSSQVLKAHETKHLLFSITEPDNHGFTWGFADESGNASAQATANGIQVSISGLNASPGDYSSKLTATDKYGASSEYILQYTVLENNAPVVIKEFGNIYIGESSGTKAVTLSEYFNDADGETLLYTVSFNSSLVHAVVNQQVLYITTKSFGLSEITVTAQDARGETVTGTFKVMVRDNSQVVDVYPNPVVDYLNIRMGEDVTGTVKVEVINSSGVKVVTDELSISPFAPARIDLSSLSSGSYIVRVVYNDIDVKRNFIKL